MPNLEQNALAVFTPLAIPKPKDFDVGFPQRDFALAIALKFTWRSMLEPV
jgi:hypothetical protein